MSTTIFAVVLAFAGFLGAGAGHVARRLIPRNAVPLSSPPSKLALVKYGFLSILPSVLIMGTWTIDFVSDPPWEYFLLSKLTLYGTMIAVAVSSKGYLTGLARHFVQALPVPKSKVELESRTTEENVLRWMVSLNLLALTPIWLGLLWFISGMWTLVTAGNG